MGQKELQKFQNFTRSIFGRMLEGRQIVRNFTQEFINRHVTKVNLKLLNKFEGWVPKKHIDISNPIETMNK